MKKYKVYGMVTVNVTKEVWANSEDEAFEKASNQLPCLTAYCGNGSNDRLIGVEEEGEAIETFDDIEYDDIRLLEDDPDYFECPDCGEQCISCIDDDGEHYWRCDECDGTFDEHGNEFCPYVNEYDDCDDEKEEED